MKKYKVTVVTVSYNAKDTVEKTILSVLHQSYSNIEYIVIDGGSTDGTVDIIQRYSDKIQHFISEPDKGIYDAMNKGIKLATGDWICYMNCGDRFFDNKVVEHVFTSAQISPLVKVIYGDTLKTMHNSTLYCKGYSIKSISKFQPFIHQSAFFSLSNKNDLFFKSEKYKITADYDVTCRLFKTYGASAFQYIPLLIAVYEAETGISSMHKRKCSKEYLKVKINNHMSLFEIIKDSIKYLLRK